MLGAECLWVVDNSRGATSFIVYTSRFAKGFFLLESKSNHSETLRKRSAANMSFRVLSIPFD